MCLKINDLKLDSEDVVAGAELLRFASVRKGNACSAAFRDAELPLPDIILVFPLARHKTCSGFVFGLQRAEPAVRNRLHHYVLEARFAAARGDAGAGLPYPLADTAVGVVVEAVHLLGTHTVCKGIAVPALP